MPELALRPAQLAGTLPSLAKASAPPTPLPGGPDDRAQQGANTAGGPRRSPLARPPLPAADSRTPPLAAEPSGRRRPSSPAARRPPGYQTLQPALPRPPAPPLPGARAAAAAASPGHVLRGDSLPPPVQPPQGSPLQRPVQRQPLHPQPVQPNPTPPQPVSRRLTKTVPKSEGAAAPQPSTGAANPPSPQQQLDRALLALLRKSAHWIRWRAPQIHRKVWQALPGRRVLLACGTLVGLFYVAWHTPLRHWSNSSIAALTHNVKARAAFQVVDDFTAGISDHWAPAGLVSDTSGVARVAGFALNRNTMELAGYRLDFDAKIARGLGWVIGAADDKNYYAFKLENVSSKQGQRYHLVRYLVSGGEAVDADRVQVDVPFELNEEGFNRISVRLRDNRIATFINGTGVDYWQAEEPPRGGVGFFTEGNETAFVRRVEVSGNEDTWGLFLYGFLELIEDARDFVQPVSARFESAPNSGPATPDPKTQTADPANLASMIADAAGPAPAHP